MIMTRGFSSVIPRSSFPMICPFLSCKRTVWRVTSTAETVLCSSSALSSAVHSNAANSRRRRSVSYSSLPMVSYCSCASLQIRLLAASSSSGWVFRMSSSSACVFVCAGADCLFRLRDALRLLCQPAEQVRDLLLDLRRRRLGADTLECFLRGCPLWQALLGLTLFSGCFK